MTIEMIGGCFLWGLVSAISLPLGAVIGLYARPGRKITSALMAFGAGALLFALTIELFSEMLHYGREHGKEVVIVTIIGAVLGGLLFDFLNQLLNNRGAFLRSLAETTRYLGRLKLLFTKRLIGQLSRVHILQSLPPQEIVKIIPNMKRESFVPGEYIFREGEQASALYFIVSGQVEILRRNKKGREERLSVLKENDTFGEMALLSHEPRNATAKTLSRTVVLKALHSDFDLLLSESEELQKSVQKLFNSRLDTVPRKLRDTRKADEWKKACIKHLRNLHIAPTDNEIESQRKELAGTSGAAMAIWLGILLDGIPESMIIGMLAKSVTGISLAFITGVFLANLPEAMSSAQGMKQSGMGFRKILLMWISICVFTGIGAAAGAMIFPVDLTGSHLYWVAGLEGLAAGAMLCMIAETMLPEAFEQGGAIVGFSTLMGFVVSLFIKIL
jgi:CRP-like cAMP-binding protein